MSSHPFRKAPLFYQKSASFLIEKRLFSTRKEALFYRALFQDFMNVRRISCHLSDISFKVFDSMSGSSEDSSEESTTGN